MPHSSTQLDLMATRRRPLATGYYHNRRRGSVIPRATMLDGPALASLLAASDAGGSPFYNLDSVWYRGGGRRADSEANFGTILSRAVCPDDAVALAEYGALESVLDRAGGHRHGLAVSAEWCAMMNVKTWRVHGGIGPFTFDETFGCGQFVGYSPEWNPPISDWVYEMAARAAYGMGFQWSEENEAGLASLTVHLGMWSSGGTPLDVLDELNVSPSPGQLMPRLVIFFSDSTPDPGLNQGANTPGFGGNIGAGTEDSAVTFLGQPVRMLTAAGYDDPVGHSIAIEAATWWGAADAWVGE